MPASSLIFVVIVAIWAAYLIQHFVRRREDAAAARSVDGFTEAMRVLEKRPLLPSTELREPRPHSYSVTPARLARPTVDVKRAIPAGAARTPSPLVARRSLSGDRQLGDRQQAVASDTRTHDNVEVETMSQPYPRTRDERPRRDHSAPSAGRPARPGPSLGQRRLRGLLLLASLAWIPVSIVLAVTGVLMWISVPFALLTVVAVLVWLRTEAQAERARAAGHGVDAELGLDAPARAGHRRFARPPVLSSDDTQVIRSEEPAARHTAASDETQLTEHSSAERVFDVQAPAAHSAAHSAAANASATSASQEVADAEGTWSPVPVPKPTYSMKVKAEPRMTASGIPADVFETPEFADEADELDDRALFARRAVSQ